jgi:hypothetical protein
MHDLSAIFLSLQQYLSVVLASMHVRARYCHARNDVVIAAEMTNAGSGCVWSRVECSEKNPG